MNKRVCGFQYTSCLKLFFGKPQKLNDTIHKTLPLLLITQNKLIKFKNFGTLKFF